MQDPFDDFPADLEAFESRPEETVGKLQKGSLMSYQTPHIARMGQLNWRCIHKAIKSDWDKAVLGCKDEQMWDMCAIFSAQRKLISEKRCKNSKSCLLLFIHMAHLSEMVRVTVKEGLEDGFLGIVGLHVNPHKAEVFFSRIVEMKRGQWLGMDHPASITMSEMHYGEVHTIKNLFKHIALEPSVGSFWVEAFSGMITFETRRHN